MKTYNSFDDINFELTRLKLKRKIALEEMKLSGHNLQDSLTPNNWLAPIFKGLKNFGFMFLLKKIFR